MLIVKNTEKKYNKHSTRITYMTYCFNWIIQFDDFFFINIFSAFSDQLVSQFFFYNYNLHNLNIL